VLDPESELCGSRCRLLTDTLFFGGGIGAVLFFVSASDTFRQSDGAWARRELLSILKHRPDVIAVATDFAKHMFENLKPGVQPDRAAGAFILNSLGLSDYASDALRHQILRAPDLDSFVGRQILARAKSCLDGDPPPA
jgi:hypothetical protein